MNREPIPDAARRRSSPPTSLSGAPADEPAGADGGEQQSQGASPKWLYDFTEGSAEMRELLGGKGAGIAEMTRILGPELVPAGFTITTEACVAYMRAGRRSQIAPPVTRTSSRSAPTI
jgi:hypothetical protein